MSMEERAHLQSKLQEIYDRYDITSPDQYIREMDAETLDDLFVEAGDRFI